MTASWETPKYQLRQQGGKSERDLRCLCQVLEEPEQRKGRRKDHLSEEEGKIFLKMQAISGD